MKPSELLSDASKWTKGAYARNASGEMVDALSPDAKCFCVRGALHRMHRSGPYYVEDSRKLTAVIDRLYPGNTGISGFNDHPETTFEDVRKVLLAAGL